MYFYAVSLGIVSAEGRVLGLCCVVCPCPSVFSLPVRPCSSAFSPGSHVSVSPLAFVSVSVCLLLRLLSPLESVSVRLLSSGIHVGLFYLSSCVRVRPSTLSLSPLPIIRLALVSLSARPEPLGLYERNKAKLFSGWSRYHFSIFCHTSIEIATVSSNSGKCNNFQTSGMVSTKPLRIFLVVFCPVSGFQQCISAKMAASAGKNDFFAIRNSFQHLGWFC